MILAGDDVPGLCFDATIGFVARGVHTQSDVGYTRSHTNQTVSRPLAAALHPQETWVFKDDLLRIKFQHLLFAGRPNTPDMADDSNDDTKSLSAQPFAWIIIPIIFLLILLIGFLAAIRRRRRRRRLQAQYHHWSRDRVLSPSGHLVYAQRPRRTASRWASWLGTRSQEGLNELGQAPPPYYWKGHDENGTELRDLEAGVRPPEYIAKPGQAATTHTRTE
ncbi:hypothetical protein EDB80DRAFT_737027 [Ilyonectria destructans]|nr:hypothetical protein EDB80DRAFT_737027 [Ilyonectria destructans]